MHRSIRSVLFLGAFSFLAHGVDDHARHQWRRQTN